MVGETGFEPATSWSQTRRATRLRYSPKAPMFNAIVRPVHHESIPRDNSLGVVHNGSVYGERNDHYLSAAPRWV